MRNPDSGAESRRQISEASVKEVVAAARNQDADAFAELVRRYQHRVYKTAVRIVKDSSEAEDIVQESFFAAYQKIQSFREEAAFSTWLTRIVINTALMHLRKRRIRQSYSLEEMTEQGVIPSQLLLSRSPAPDDLCMENERLYRMRILLQEISPNLREITLDRLSADLSIREIAQKRGLSEAAIKSRLLRARQTLTHRMGILDRRSMQWTSWQDTERLARMPQSADPRSFQ
ncbi:MAG: sigma-70 family RNA polymerase sigma factor [Edaphobacter sp.]|uniref:RNA polymerase sigma factor n=1 Tax=Edaphobacter sp. TaxID=1934404 RepID=UPI00238C727E|nr:sigma-70 family RNA polymerase sigma factor [Edaphobacter sp.]MDE1176457.1 sigma-70 family RNA polymerase sigma factor [Edaphobacter sp.]